MSRSLLLALLVAGVAAGLWLFGQPSATPVPDLSSTPSAAPPVAPAQTPPEIAYEPEAGENSPPPPAEPPVAAEPLPAPRAADRAAATPEEAARAAKLREEGLQTVRKLRVEEGLAMLKEAVNLDPSPDNHAAYGRVLRDLTAMQGALYHLRAAAEKDPSNADRWIELANAYYLKPDPGAAWKAEKRAKEAEPGLQLQRKRGKVRRADDTGPGGE